MKSKIIVSVIIILIFCACAKVIDKPSVTDNSTTKGLIPAEDEATAAVKATPEVAATIPVTVDKVLSEENAVPVHAEFPKNMVDERYELLSLVFRLAERLEYSETYTEYERELNEHFDDFRNDPVVIYAKELPIGYDSVLRYAIHIEKVDDRFSYIDDLRSLSEQWSEENISIFLPLLSDFYANCNFADFYVEHLPYYEKITAEFIDATYAQLDLDWFSAYTNPESYRCIFSANNYNYNYGASIFGGEEFYAGVSGDGRCITHEYCHRFANQLAEIWYENDDAFRDLCDKTVNTDNMPFYSSGMIIAYEYVTRAFDTLYMVVHGSDLQERINLEIYDGFPYIEEVYEMAKAYIPEKNDDEISYITTDRINSNSVEIISADLSALRFSVAESNDSAIYLEITTNADKTDITATCELSGNTLTVVASDNRLSGNDGSTAATLYLPQKLFTKIEFTTKAVNADITNCSAAAISVDAEATLLTGAVSTETNDIMLSGSATNANLDLKNSNARIRIDAEASDLTLKLTEAPKNTKAVVNSNASLLSLPSGWIITDSNISGVSKTAEYTSGEASNIWDITISTGTLKIIYAG